MKKFILIVLIITAIFFLYSFMHPKIIFINKSNQNLHINRYYINDLYKYKKKYPDADSFIESGEYKYLNRYVLLLINESLGYSISFPNNKKSYFSARWSSADKNSKQIHNEMSLDDSDFGWRNIIFIIDENGDYHKKMP